MNIYYRIVEHNEQDRTIVVRYYTDEITEEELASSEDRRPDGTPVRCRSDVALTIPIPEPSELGLHKMILRAAPKKALEILEVMKTGDEKIKQLSNLNKLMNKTFKKTEEEYEMLIKLGGPATANSNTSNTPVFTTEQIERFLAPVNAQKT